MILIAFFMKTINKLWMNVLCVKEYKNLKKKRKKENNCNNDRL